MSSTAHLTEGLMYRFMMVINAMMLLLGVRKSLQKPICAKMVICEEGIEQTKG